MAIPASGHSREVRCLWPEAGPRDRRRSPAAGDATRRRNRPAKPPPQNPDVALMLATFWRGPSWRSKASRVSRRSDASVSCRSVVAARSLSDRCWSCAPSVGASWRRAALRSVPAAASGRAMSAATGCAPRVIATPTSRPSIRSPLDRQGCDSPAGRCAWKETAQRGATAALPCPSSLPERDLTDWRQNQREAERRPDRPVGWAGPAGPAH